MTAIKTSHFIKTFDFGVLHTNLPFNVTSEIIRSIQIYILPAHRSLLWLIQKEKKELWSNNSS